MNHMTFSTNRPRHDVDEVHAEIVGAIAVSTRRIGDVNVCVQSLEGALGQIRDAVGHRRAGVWGFCNAHTVNMARSHLSFRSVLEKMTLFNDGVGLDLASRLLYGVAFPENLNGTDLVPLLLGSLPAATSVFLVGSAPGVASAAADTIRERYPNIAIAGVQHGFFAAGEEDGIVERIAASGAQLVLVGMGHPFQELWSARARARIDTPLLCVGAFLDFTAGTVSRAPQLVRKLHLEWLYRLCLEPRRLAKRYLLGNVLFLAFTFAQRLCLRGARCR